MLYIVHCSMFQVFGQQDHHIDISILVVDQLWQSFINWDGGSGHTYIHTYLFIGVGMYERIYPGKDM